MKKINWFTHTTGDPFADIGGMVIECLQKKRRGEPIIELIKEAVHIYVKRWNGNLYSFFLNSPVTHPSSKGQKGIDKTIAYYKKLLDGIGGTEGYCRITGQKTMVFPAGRDNHIMSGSSAFVNFHHGLENGIQLSKEALIRIFFVPLGVEQLGDKVAAVISNNEDVTRFFAQKNVTDNLKAIGNNISKSIVRSDFSNPSNALFDYANQCIDNIKTATYDEETELSNTRGTVLNLFHFTNYGTSPTVQLITLPATVFAFYAYCLLYHRAEWQNFILRQYKSSAFKNAEYDSLSQTWRNSKDKAGFDIYKAWRNPVFWGLLNGRSNIIRAAFLRHSKRHVFNFNIVEQFQLNIQSMDKRALIKIRELADFIVKDRSEDDIKKTMVRLNGEKGSSALRRFLLKLADRNYREGNEKPLFSLEEYVEYLFPDGTYWSEIRDLLLIAIYQELHRTNKKIEIELAEAETEKEREY